MFSIYLHIILGGFMFSNSTIFKTKERAENYVELDLKEEMETNIIEGDTIKENEDYHVF